MPQISPMSWVMTTILLLILMISIKSNMPPLCLKNPKISKNVYKNKEMKW